MTTDPHIAAIRSFNRFYTRAIGTLEEHLLQSSLSLPEARVLYEIATRTQPTASEIAATLNLDLGYLSRILRTFINRKLLTRKTSPTDARQSFLSLTKSGQKEFAVLNQRSNQQIEQLIAPFTDTQRIQLVQAMSTIEIILSPSTTQPPFILRPHRPGDMGWVVQNHGLLYAREYGWDERFEALVARITADFIDNFDPTRERCWIAERNGESIGSVFLVKDKKSRTTARLRLLLVDPSARGLGLGRTLVRECTQFARNVGYRKITLWTNSVLEAARHLYQAEGYHLISEETHHSFGKKLTGQTWELQL
ncbi:MAG TPA: helix-turn-helix domain-containing GNAT family N-acetyltransferase [Edaphobacter sp.]|nr:helix-turn-helix domain-containing GNAT family N-acetyltransferase [Edaphobacter sp.]